jgi:RNA polymerase sigma-70 factor (ECF subfamily)
VAGDPVIELRQLLEGGDHRAVQARMYREYGGAVRRFVATRVPASAVDDICQEVWAAVVRGLGGYHLDAPPRAWLLAIARNKSNDLWRRDNLVETLDSQLGEGGPLADLLGLRSPASPTRELSRRRRSERVQRALRALRDDERELLELRFVQGLKPAEIAHLVGSSANTASQRVVRAARHLRELLAGDA